MLVGAVQKRMQFETGDIRAPDQRGQIVDQDVADIAAAIPARNRRDMHPLGRIPRGVFLVEDLARYAVGIGASE